MACIRYLWCWLKEPPPPSFSGVWDEGFRSTQRRWCFSSRYLLTCRRSRGASRCLAPEKLQASCLLVNCSLVQAVELHSIGTGGSMQLHLWSQEWEMWTFAKLQHLCYCYQREWVCLKEKCPRNWAAAVAPSTGQTENNSADPMTSPTPWRSSAWYSRCCLSHLIFGISLSGLGKVVKQVVN